MSLSRSTRNGIEPFDRLPGHFAGADQFIELTPRVRHAMRGHALRVHALVEHPVVAGVSIAHQRAAPGRRVVAMLRARLGWRSAQEGQRVWRPPPRPRQNS